MNLTEAKDQLKIEIDHILDSGANSIRLIELFERVTKLYTSEKVKEALHVAISTAMGYVSEADGELLSHFIGELETELVNNIKNDK